MAQTTKPLSKAQQILADRDEALQTLHGILKPGSTVYGIVRSVARSGMSRTIDFYAVEDGRMRYLSGYVAKALHYPRTRDGALKVHGCGMDMVFHVVYSLGSALWRNGTDEPHGTRNGEPDRAGGYALKSEIL